MKWSITTIIILSILLAAGCGGEASEESTTDTAEQVEEVSMDPEALAGNVADAYNQMYLDLDAAVNQGLSAEELASQIYAMKEDSPELQEAGIACCSAQ